MRHFSKSIVKQEVLAGLTTFFTMAYIVVIAPAMYAQQGADFDNAFVATCLVIISFTLIGGLFVGLPIAFAPGLGLISYFCFTMIESLHFTWSQALTAVFIAGVIFMMIMFTPVRRLILLAIPQSIQFAVAAGIGFLIGLIALKNVGILLPSLEAISQFSIGFHEPVLIFLMGFILIVILDRYRVPGAMLIGIVFSSLLGSVLGLHHFKEIFSWPYFTFQKVGHFDYSALATKNGVMVIITFIVIMLFDTTSTLLGLTKLADFGSNQEVNQKLNRALLVKSVGSVFAPLFGVTTLSPFIESAAGIEAGGRTGLTAIVISICFLLTLFCAPLASDIPPYATASALFYVACLMVKPFIHFDWKDRSELIPALVTLFSIPLSFSIADGVGIGIICYVVLKCVKREWRAIKPMLWILAILFMGYFVL